MICIKCGGDTKVIDSRLNPGFSKKRRRECKNCKTRFITYEILEDDYNNLGADFKFKKIQNITLFELVTNSDTIHRIGTLITKKTGEQT